MVRPTNVLLRSYYENGGSNQVICNNGKCKNRLLNKHAGNLERHLKNFHPRLFFNYLPKKKENNELQKSQNERDKSEKVKNETVKIDTVENKTIECDTVKLCYTVNKKHIHTALIELFTKCDTPLHLVEERPFKILFNPLLDELKIELDELNILEKIAEFSLNLKKEISEELCGRLISLKIDAATGASDRLLGVNVQYIGNNSVVIKTLAVKQLTQPHTKGYLKALILAVLYEYGINLEQVVTITTDSGAKMIEAVNEYSHEGITYSSDEFCIEADLLSIDSDFSIDEISHIECGAYTLQLCVIDVMKSAGIKEKLDIIRSTVLKILRTPLYLKKLNSKNYKMPLLDNINRWTSTYLMLERFMELKEFIEDINIENVSLDLCNEIWSFAAEFLKVFQIIYTTSKNLQSENFIYSDLYIEITTITIQVESLPNSNLKTILIESLNRRKLILFEYDLFVTAIFLDPRIKVCLASDQCARAKSCIMQLYTRLLTLRERETESKTQFSETCGSTISPDSCASSPTSIMAEDALEEYFKAFDHSSNKKIKTETHQIEQDILIYERQSRLSIKENILEFWSKMKSDLSDIALLVLGIPCSQASIQRLFSALEYIQADERSKLISYRYLEHILLVKSNANFVYD